MGNKTRNRPLSKEQIKERKTLIIQLLKSGKKNQEIFEVIKNKFGIKISGNIIADCRAELGMSGPNRRKGKIVTKTEEKLLVIQNHSGYSISLQNHLQAILNRMGIENIQAIFITSDGKVRIQQVGELNLVSSTKPIGLWD